MKNRLYKLALQTAAPVLCGLIVWNAYLVARNLELLRKNTDLRAEVSKLQADISNVALDLLTLESSQRGYLLTGDNSYLRPYDEAQQNLAAHFADLRSRLTVRDRSLAAELETVADAKIAEMQETIRLRRLGYRHRAFLIVGSNQGREWMEKARTLLQALASAQAGDLAALDRAWRASLGRAFQALALVNSILLLVTVGAIFAFHRYRTGLELGYARHEQELRATSRQLERLSSTIFLDCRALLREIQDHAQTVLRAYGAFLPRQGHEKVERIEDGAGRMAARLDEFSKTLPENSSDRGAVPDLQTLSA